MSTTVAPADDMSITIAPAGVVLVYKPRSMCLKKAMRMLLMKSPPHFVKSKHPKCDDMRAYQCEEISVEIQMCGRPSQRDNAYRGKKKILVDEKKLKPVKKKCELPHVDSGGGSLQILY